MYSRGKQELEKEKARKYSPEEILALTKAVNTVAAETYKTLKETSLYLEKVKSQVDSRPAVQEMTNNVRVLQSEVRSLSEKVTELINQKAQNTREEAAVLAKLKESLEYAAIDQL